MSPQRMFVDIVFRRAIVAARRTDRVKEEITKH